MWLISFANISKRLNYVNHARHLADGDWTGADYDEGEDMEKQEEGERRAEDEGMEVERRKLPKHYANQVRRDFKHEASSLQGSILTSRGRLAPRF